MAGAADHDGAPVAGHGVNPTLLGTVARSDVFPGKSVQQVTYGGLPLYRVILDEHAPGQTTGADMLDPATSPQGVWYLVDPSGGRLATGQALNRPGNRTRLPERETHRDSSATVLAVSREHRPVRGGRRRRHRRWPGERPRLYLQPGQRPPERVRGDVRLCTGHPLLTSASPLAGAGVDRQQLGVIVRPDGTHQVTFDGHPLYTFHQDAVLPLLTPVYPTSINGAGALAFGGLWQAVQP